MSPILEYVYQMTGIDTAYILIGILALELILLILVIISLCKLKKYTKKLKKFMTGKDAESLEEILNGCVEKTETVNQMNQSIREDITALRKNQRITYQKLGLQKYNAFRELSGDLSYAVALLDQEDNGFIINSVYAKEGGYSYIKKIEHGECEIELSEEEKKALTEAKNRS